MRKRPAGPRISGTTVTQFSGNGVAARIARLLVLEMVLWPGLLFIGGSLIVAWRLREQPVALGLLLIATAFSTAVGIRQWGVMLRAIRPPVTAPDPLSLNSASKEVSPRLTGRGTTREG